jgi:lipopolysaccharide biosynthesis glycosyltransferase/polysaccharide pyruvyl transferase WcaK-like protein
MNKKNCFVISCDANYCIGALALINSIRSCSEQQIVFMDTGIYPDQKIVIQEKVDKIVDIKPQLSEINFQTKHKYQKVFALSSLYSHYSGYEKLIFMDADTLLLDNVDFVFDLLNDFDIVGVRAGVRGYLENYQNHILSDEIYQDSQSIILSQIPNLNLNGLAINTGFFGINSYVLQEWELRLPDLIPLLPHFKFTDQAIFNILLNSSSFTLKELHWKYNFAGISDSLDEQNFQFKLFLDSSKPQFLYRGKPIVVPHFSGKPKPWELSNQSSGFKIWNFFSEMESNNYVQINSTCSEGLIYSLEHNARVNTFILEKYLQNNTLLKDSCLFVLGIGYDTFPMLRFMRACGSTTLGLKSDSTISQFFSSRYGIDVENISLHNLTLPKKPNVVILSSAIEYVKNPIYFFAEIHNLLAEGGNFFFEYKKIDQWCSDAIDFRGDDISDEKLSEQALFSFLRIVGFDLIASGWHGENIWILSKKTQNINYPLDNFNTEQTRQCLQEASLNSKQILSFVSQKLNKKFVSLAKRSILLVKISPLQIPSKVVEKVKRRFVSPTNPLDAQNIALKSNRTGVKHLNIAHVGLHGNGNAGDTLLFPAVRWLFQKEVSPSNFTLIPLRDPVTQETIDKINQQDALVIGGGGLFLADSNPNEQSGWQWACPLELLEQIKVPIILFAVGYNRFRGQEEFAPIFEKNVQRLIEKSAFVGIRNRGSIESLKSYLPESLHEKIHYQPCPTTILRHFYPDLPQYQEASQPTLAVNIAFDRHHLRFGQREHEILWSMGDAFLELERQGWQIKLFNHVSIDNDARFWFKARGLFAQEVNIGGVPPIDILREYSQATIAVGMRGHAQMIPFGLHRPIYSLISHDKLQFFLDDINHSDWGVEVQDPNLGEKLVRDINNLYTNLPQIETQLKAAQSELWKITLQNLEMIKNSINV